MDLQQSERVGICSFCGSEGGGHRLDCQMLAPAPLYPFDEPAGTCVIHGDYWTDDCLRCRGER